MPAPPRRRATAVASARVRLRRAAAATRRLSHLSVSGSARPAVVVAVLVAIFGGLFVASYGLVLGRPQPRDIRGDLVGSKTAAEQPVVRRLERAAGTSLRLKPVRSEAAARDDLAHQHAYTALVLTGRPRLLVASASGSSVSRVLEQAAMTVPVGAGTLRTVDVEPLPRSDPNGLVVFYATLAATIMGFVSMFQIRAHAGALGLRAWRGFIALIAVLNGVVIGAVSGPAIGALGGSLVEKCVILGVESAIAGTVCSTLLVLIGRWAIAPNWLLFVVLGNTSSGGAVAPPLLPGPYELLNRWLSPGATVEALRSAVYFRGAQPVQPLLVLAGWLIVGQLALELAVRRKRRLPTGAAHEPRAV